MDSYKIYNNRRYKFIWILKIVYWQHGHNKNYIITNVFIEQKLQYYDKTFMGMYQILCSKYLIECDKYDVMNWYKQGQKSLKEKRTKYHRKL